MPEPRRQTRRRTTTPKTPAAKTIPQPASPGSSEPTPSSSATSDANPLGLEPDAWQPPEGPLPADTETGDVFEPEPPQALEWTPERAGALVRAGGFLLHTADGLTREPEGSDLWRATEADVDAIAPPLSRILNRYAPARRLAGVSDEAELALGLMAYARKNLADRGRVVSAKKHRDELAAEHATTDAAGTVVTWPEQEPPAAEA